MKQTAVEWLVEQLRGNENIRYRGTNINDLEKQAKAMEKEQQRLIYEGLLQNVGTSIKQSDLPTFEQYYTEAYGK